ncbi:MAG: hypothetical protein AAFQ64_08600 [Pseudomonadota bacterium]
MRLKLALLVSLGLAACSTRPPAAPPPPVQSGPEGAADTCGAAPYRYLIGEEATALERVLILRSVRVNWPEDQLDGASKPDRLNFNINALGKIVSLTCG